MRCELINGTSCIAVDPENEYARIAEAADGQVVRLAASSAHCINPFDLPPPSFDRSQDEGDPLAERVAALLGLLDVMLCGSDTPGGAPGSLDNHLRAVLDRAVYRTYARAGITADIATHTRPAPLLKDLHAVLSELPGEAAASLAVRLERYVTGSLSAALVSGPTNVELDRRLIVFNIQQLEDELRPLAIHLIASWVWTRIRGDRRPRLLVIDEAWSLLRFPDGGAFVAAMARSARKYYLRSGDHHPAGRRPVQQRTRRNDFEQRRPGAAAQAESRHHRCRHHALPTHHRRTAAAARRRQG